MNLQLLVKSGYIEFFKCVHMYVHIESSGNMFA